MSRVHTAAVTKVNNATTTELITVLAKYGVGSLIAIYLVYTMTTGVQADLKDVRAEARGIRTEHVQMGMYLQAICYGVSKSGTEWRCQAADSYSTTHSDRFPSPPSIAVDNQP